MKNMAKNAKRIISLALSMCIVMLSISGAFVVGAAEAASVPSGNLIAGGDMEGFTVGTSQFNGYYGNREIVATDSHSGEKSLHFGATDDSAKPNAMFIPLSSVTDPTKTYLFSAYVKINGVKESTGNGADVYAKFLKEDNKNVAGNYGNNFTLISGETNGEWVRIATTFSGANVKAVEFYAYSDDMYVDDLCLEELIVPDTGLFADGNMESFNVGDKKFAGWGNNSKVVTTEAHTGAKSLYLGEFSGPNKIYANLTSVTDSAKTYLFSAYVKLNSVKDNQGSGADVYAKFIDENGAEIAGNVGKNFTLYSGETNGEWVRIATTFSGANIKTVVLHVYSDDAYVDDISVEELIVPDTGLFADGTMESFNVGDKKFAGWGNNSKVVTTEAHTGAKSLYLGEFSGPNKIYANLTSVTDSAKTYLFSAYIKVNSVKDNLGSGADVYAKFIDENGAEIAGNVGKNFTLYSGETNGKWVRVTTTFSGANIKTVVLHVYSDDAYVDDISVTELVLPNTGLISGGHMEGVAVGDKLGSTAGVAGVVDTEAYSGIKSMHVGGTATLTNITVPFTGMTEAGKTYLFSIKLKVNSVNTDSNKYDVWVQFFDANGNSFNNGDYMSQHKLAVGTTDGEWVTVSKLVSGIEAKGIYLFVRSNDTYIDDVSMVELDLPDTGLIPNGHLEASEVGTDPFSAGGYSGNRTVVNTEAYSGEKSLQLGATETATSPNSIFKTLTSATDPAKTYLFSAYVKVNSVKDNQGSGADIYAKFITSDGTEMKGDYYNNITLLSGTTNGEWVRIAKTFTGVTVQSIVVYAYSDDMLVDDLSVVALDDTAIVPDGSFENDSNYYNAKGYYTIDSTVAHTGERSLKVTTSDVTGSKDGENWREINNLKNIYIDPTKTYKLKVWAKADTATDSSTMYFKYTQENQAPKYKYFSLTTEWAEYEMYISQLDTSAVTTLVQLDLGVTDINVNVTVWFDDLSVEETPDLYTNVVSAISTGELGDTYFVDDAAARTYKFDLTIENGESYDLTNATAKIDIYNYVTERHVSTQSIDIGTVSAGETFKKNIKVYGATEFGTYRVAITLSNADFTNIYDRYFTVAKKSYQQNSFLAINEHHTAGGGQDVHGLIKPAGFGWVSNDILWSQNLAEDGTTLSFASGMDTFIEKCESEGLKIRANVSISGGFPADSNGNGYIDTLEEAAAFGDFCSAMAAKYKGKIAAYEIISEYPYIMETKGLKAVAGEYYAWALKEAYTAIKAEDPEALVIIGAMNCSYDYNLEILEDMLTVFADDESDGDEYYFDVFAIHPYTNPSSPMDGDEERLSVEDTVAKYKTLLVDYWEINKPIWLTEVGFSTATESRLPNTVEEQAAYLMQLYLSACSIENVERLSLYNLQSGYNYVNDDDLAQYGITGYDTNHTLYTKPAYATIQTMTNLLNNINFVSKSEANNVHKYVFTNAEGKYITAIWTADGSDALATVAAGNNASATIVDSWGNELEMAGSEFLFNIGITPVFVVTESAVGDITTSDAIVRTAPVLAGNFNNYIEVLAEDGVEYSIDGITYGTETKFENLKPNTVYTIFSRNTAAGVSGTAKFRTSAHGDLNSNSLFDGVDLTMMKKLLFTGKDPADVDVDAKDVDDNGAVDITDLVKLKKLTLQAQ